MENYILRIKSKDLSLETLLEKLVNLPDVRITDQSKKMVLVGYEGTLEQLNNLLGYENKEVLISPETTYSIE
ncbi:MAG: hypothetical protein Q8Q01_05455 [archaeon]|nr:hypothetical protein [archaeon]